MSDDKEIAAQERAATWSKLQYPCAPFLLSETEYEKLYLQRSVFRSKTVMSRVQEAIRAIFCPACLENAARGMVRASRLYITIDDDIMTVFKAMGHFACHHCDFEEYHPLKTDPRRTSAPIEEQIVKDRQRFFGNSILAGPPVYGGPSNLMNDLGAGGYSIGQGGPFLGTAGAGISNCVSNSAVSPAAQTAYPDPSLNMTKSEYAALQRLYATKAQNLDPPKEDLSVMLDMLKQGRHI